MHKCVSSMFEWYASDLLAPCLFPLLTVNLAMFPTHTAVTNMSETSETKRIISKIRSSYRFNICGDNVFGVFGGFFFKAAKSQTTGWHHPGKASNYFMPADTLSDKGPGGGGNWVTLEDPFEDFFPFPTLGDMIISYLKGISVYLFGT